MSNRSFYEDIKDDARSFIERVGNQSFVSPHRGPVKGRPNSLQDSLRQELDEKRKIAATINDDISQKTLVSLQKQIDAHEAYISGSKPLLEMLAKNSTPLKPIVLAEKSIQAQTPTISTKRSTHDENDGFRPDPVPKLDFSFLNEESAKPSMSQHQIFKNITVPWETASTDEEAQQVSERYSDPDSQPPSSELHSVSTTELATAKDFHEPVELKPAEDVEQGLPATFGHSGAASQSNSEAHTDGIDDLTENMQKFSLSDRSFAEVVPSLSSVHSGNLEGHTEEEGVASARSEALTPKEAAEERRFNVSRRDMIEDFISSFSEKQSPRREHSPRSYDASLISPRMRLATYTPPSMSPRSRFADQISTSLIEGELKAALSESGNKSILEESLDDLLGIKSFMKSRDQLRHVPMETVQDGDEEPPLTDLRLAHGSLFDTPRKSAFPSPPSTASSREPKFAPIPPIRTAEGAIELIEYISQQIAKNVPLSAVREEVLKRIRLDDLKRTNETDWVRSNVDADILEQTLQMSQLFMEAASAEAERLRELSQDWASQLTDAEYQFLHKSELPSYHFQKSLRRLPIPKLSDTANRYLASAKVVLSEADYARTEKLMREFENGEGKELQEELLKYDKNHKDTSYISEPWFDIYLRARVPCPVNYNPFMMYAADPNEKFMEQATRATNFAISYARIKKSLDAEVLAPEVFHMNPKKSDTKTFRRVCRMLPPSLSWFGAVAFKAFPLDMSQYKSLFNGSRVPKKEKWADARRELEDLGNGEQLRQIDGAMFALCLDDLKTTDHKRLVQSLLIGDDGSNRWFDKCFQLIVDELLKKCSDQHSQLVKEASMGQGFDRHLLGLRITAERLGKPLPVVFQDASYNRMGHFVLSTSTLSTETIVFGGFGPVVNDGFGVGYNVVPSKLGAVISSVKKKAQTFADALTESLDTLRGILVK
ncbi:unnamed protein product, partial [Mesorhabditis spiculigera]